MQRNHFSIQDLETVFEILLESPDKVIDYLENENTKVFVSDLVKDAVERLSHQLETADQIKDRLEVCSVIYSSTIAEKQQLKEKLLEFSKFKIGDKVVYNETNGFVDRVFVTKSTQSNHKYGIHYFLSKVKKDGTQSRNGLPFAGWAISEEVLKKGDF